MSIATGPAETPRHPPQWWETRLAVAVLMLLSTVPLLWPDIPPLLDLPGHMGRYRIQLDLATSPALQQFYAFEWRLIGNLGVDLLVELLAPLLGLELAVKLIVATIPALTVGGLLWVAREVHGRVPPTALFAVPFAYNFPFLFGFVNFALSMALALLAFAFWLRLARLGRLRLRAALFVPISLALWVVHAFGWGTLGLLAFSAELVRQYDGGRNVIAAGYRAGLHCLSLVPPVALMLLWRSDSAGQTGDWFNWDRKLDWLVMSLRDRWDWFDLAALGLAMLVIVAAPFFRQVVYSRNLFASALFLIAIYILLPRIVFGSAYADMRLAPYLFAIALVAIRFNEGACRRLVNVVAIAGALFIAARTAGTTASMWLYDRSFDSQLAALDHVPHGARMISFVGRPCEEPWGMSRLLHLPGMAIVRRHAFSNDQWTMEGAQLLDVHYGAGWPFIRDPSQIVTRGRCRHEVWRPADVALAGFPRAAFDYVWLIDPPVLAAEDLVGLTPLWRGEDGALYRVDRAATANSETPAGIGTRPTR